MDAYVVIGALTTAALLAQLGTARSLRLGAFILDGKLAWRLRQFHHAVRSRRARDTLMTLAPVIIYLVILVAQLLNYFFALTRILLLQFVQYVLSIGKLCLEFTFVLIVLVARQLHLFLYLEHFHVLAEHFTPSWGQHLVNRCDAGREYAARIGTRPCEELLR